MSGGKKEVLRHCRALLSEWCKANDCKGSLSSVGGGDDVWCCEITSSDGLSQTGMHFSCNPVEAVWGAEQAAEWGLKYDGTGCITSDGRITDARFSMEQLALRSGMKIKSSGKPCGPAWPYQPLSDAASEAGLDT